MTAPGYPALTEAFRCDTCGSAAVVIAPGQDGERAADLFLVSRPVADRCWCWAHWEATYRVPA